MSGRATLVAAAKEGRLGWRSAQNAWAASAQWQSRRSEGDVRVEVFGTT